jgi:hypothetical protein
MKILYIKINKLNKDLNTTADLSTIIHWNQTMAAAQLPFSSIHQFNSSTLIDTPVTTTSTPSMINGFFPANNLSNVGSTPFKQQSIKQQPATPSSSPLPSQQLNNSNGSNDHLISIQHLQQKSSNNEITKNEQNNINNDENEPNGEENSNNHEDTNATNNNNKILSHSTTNNETANSTSNRSSSPYKNFNSSRSSSPYHQNNTHQQQQQHLQVNQNKQSESDHNSDLNINNKRIESPLHIQINSSSTSSNNSSNNSSPIKLNKDINNNISPISNKRPRLLENNSNSNGSGGGGGGNSNSIGINPNNSISIGITPNNNSNTEDTKSNWILSNSNS